MTSQPHEIEDMLSRYDAEVKQIESNYMDLILYSEGAINYQEIMNMSLPEIKIFSERLNAKMEQLQQAINR